jgi:N-acetylglutamate synthase-like GNAT family acetyltransferase
MTNSNKGHRVTTYHGISIRHEIKPGDMGYIVYLHGTLYAKEYDFDRTFDAYVAEPLARFVMHCTERERLWIAEKDEQIVGSVAIVQASEQAAQLRWLILHPVARGLGLGRKLVQVALKFAQSRDYKNVFLWTVNFLDAAVGLYKSMGFEKTEEETHQIWGRHLTEEKYVRQLQTPPDPSTC